ncbi:MAG: InlB B-repeat-containing protein, partial [Clostridia bacterium]|nr:InlB B-repeat-containing protein [Clostridia bacterium]
ASVFIILGISLLGAYVIVPKSSKNAYIKQVGQYIENNFLENYYNYSLTTTEDGTSKVAYERAYVDETGVNYESVNESGKKIIVKDGIRYNGTNNTKEVFVLETLDVKDVFYEFTKDKIDEEFSLKDIKYIRKLNDGFYLKFDKNLITKELTSSQKKQIKFLTPFEGNILLNGDKLKSITASVVFKFNGEKHKIKSELEFDFVKPSINFSENVLENTPWNTFKTLSDNEIVSNLAGSKNFKEINLQTQDLSNAKVFNDNCYYFVDNTLYVYNLKDEEEITKMDVSSYLEVKTTLSYPVVTYAYKNKVCFYHSSRAYVVDIKLGVLDKVLSAYSDVSSIVCGGNSIISYKTGEFLNLDDLTVQTYSSSSRPMYFDGGWFYYTYNNEICELKTQQKRYNGNCFVGKIGNYVYTANNYFIYEYEGNNFTQKYEFEAKSASIITTENSYLFLNYLIDKSNLENVRKILSLKHDYNTPQIYSYLNGKALVRFYDKYAYVDVNDKFLAPYVAEGKIIHFSQDKFDVIILGNKLFKIFDEKEIDYKISYENLNKDANMVFEHQNPLRYDYNTDTFTLYNPTAKNFEFLGWSTSVDGVPSLSVSVLKGSIGKKTFYAHWKEKTYGLEYNLDGGEYNGEKLDSYNFYTEDNKIFFAPTKQNYDFIGWYYGEEKIDSIDKLLYFEANVLTAKWEYTYYKIFINGFHNVETTWTITFDSQGGTEIDSIMVNQTNSFAYPETPLKTGYVFKGWYLDKNCTIRFNFTENILQNTTLYAGWEKLPTDVGDNYDDVKYGTGIGIKTNYQSTNSDTIGYNFFYAQESGYYTFRTDTTSSGGVTSKLYDYETGEMVSWWSAANSNVYIQKNLEKGKLYYITTDSKYSGYIIISVTISSPIPKVTSKAEKSDKTYETSVQYNSEFTLPTFSNVEIGGYYYFDDNNEKVYLTDKNGNSLAPYTFAKDITLYFEVEKN